jgi:hypothetical protein
MKTTEKLQIAKEILATTFIVATESNKELGLLYKYNSYPIKDGEDFKGWHFEVSVKEPGYPEVIIQQFRYARPNNLDIKQFELQVIYEVFGTIVQNSLFVWFQTAKYLAQDKELQKEIINETKKDNIASY